MRKWASGTLIRNTLWMLGGFGFRLGVQFATFVVVARVLKPEAFGVFSGCLAVVSVLVPFATWGTGNILIKHTARTPALFSAYWGAALLTALLSGLVLIVGAVGIGFLLFSPQLALTVMAPIAVADLLGTRCADLASQAFQAQQKLSGTSVIWSLVSLLRLAGAIALWWLPLEKTAALWSFFYMLSGLGSGLFGVFWVRALWGGAQWSLKPLRGQWREGFYFAISLSAQGAYNDIDKTLLLRFGTGDTAGAYAACYRLVDAGFTPIKALLASTYPRFFQEGAKGLGAALRFSRKLLPWSCGYGIVAWLGLAVCAPLFPFILGRDYAMTPAMIPWLAPLLLIRTVHFLAADALTGSGYQGHRSAAQVGVAALNLVLNLWWIPRYGWLGAAWSSLVSDGALAVGLWVLARSLRKRHGEAPV